MAGIRLKTAKGRRPSSQRWLRRQLNDPYVAAARKQGYRSRAAFKLSELDDRFGFLRKDAHVLDLGAAPGGWSQVAAERVGPSGRVVAADLNPLDPIAGVTVLTFDALAPEAPAALRAAMGGQADVVLSDMAAPSTGHRATDHLRIVALVEAAAAIAGDVLAPGGSFVAKVFQGGTEAKLLAELKRRFASVRHAKPKASRSESAEIYVIATGFRSAPGAV
ncbi:MAG: RlmE family RNA methyltransferase [Alphaproteobacteria bacterium]|nr:RlmE family RNA methyltransferase [Alphaproteobacteria bacterium]